MTHKIIFFIYENGASLKYSSSLLGAFLDGG